MTAISRTVAASTTQTSPLLLVEGLTKHFNKVVQAVDDVSFVVNPYETLGVVGESGCGKSTTAKLLMHLIEPDTGKISFDGLEVGTPQGISIKELRRRMQMVFQDSFASLNPRLTIQGTIAFGPRVHGMPKAEANEKARDLLDRVGLDPNRFLRRYPHELSGGQRQRANIARALAMSPDLVVMDEAVSALDKSVEAQVLNLLSDLKSSLNLSYLFISHDLSVVQYISDRVMVMYLGRVVEIGPVDTIYDSPRHPYTRALLSARPTMDPSRRTTKAPLIGDPPSPLNPPSGCRFRTRCPFAEDVCAAQTPILSRTTSGEKHVVACHMADASSGHSKGGEAA